MRISLKPFLSGTVLGALLLLSFGGGSLRINRSLLVKRPTTDLHVVLVPVPVDSLVPADHWIRHYDAYVSRIPWRNEDSNYLPLHFIPRGKPPHIELSRNDSLEFEGALSQRTAKPFCPTQADMDSALPFVLYLDYISSDLTGTGVDHARIRLPY